MKKLLVIANPFPPQASAGTTRVLRLLRHLPALGWEPTVLTCNARGEAPVPEFVRVVRTPVPVPRQLLRGGRRGAAVNRWLFVPDPYAPWIPTAVTGGRQLLAHERFDALFSSQPRPSVHVVAASLARHSGLPWMADYRDPWFDNAFRTFATPLHASAHRRLEAHALHAAAGLSAVNRPILDELLSRHPWLAGRELVLPNGYDSGETPTPADLGPGFWFVYTGRLYGREKALEDFLTALKALPEDVKALFVGDNARVRPVAERLGILHRVRLEEFVPHATALGYQQAADALVLMTGRRAESMSSKVFEYLRSGRPVFAVTAPHSAASALLAEVGGGVTVAHDDDMAAPLARFVTSVRAGDGPQADTAALARYDMGSVAAQLAAVLDRLAAGGGRR